MYLMPCGFHSFTNIYTGRVVVSTGLGVCWSGRFQAQKGRFYDPTLLVPIVLRLFTVLTGVV
jgi:hypothetical protein